MSENEVSIVPKPHFTDGDLRPIRCGDIVLKPDGNGSTYDVTPSIRLTREKLEQLREAIVFVLAHPQDARPAYPGETIR